VVAVAVDAEARKEADEDEDDGGEAVVDAAADAGGPAGGENTDGAATDTDGHGADDGGARPRRRASSWRRLWKPASGAPPLSSGTIAALDACARRRRAA